MILVTALLSMLATEPEPACLKNCVVSDAGLQMTSSFEGYVPFIYSDPVGIKTIGFGHVIHADEHFPEPLLPPDAFELLRTDAKRSSRIANKAIDVPLRQNQFDALNDFAFNLGSLRTLATKVNAKQHNLVPKEMERYCYAKGLLLRGLQKRRQAEGEYYVK